jgi:tetratricopeptide (TPR) repeat protein
MRGRAAVLAIVTLGLLGRAAPLSAQSQTPASAAALEQWVTAVRAHEPGRPDLVVASVAGFTYETRRDLNTAMPMFIACLRGEKFATRTAPQRKVLFLARSVEENPGIAAFLKRAAVLHADALIFADRFPRTDSGPASTTGIDPRTGSPSGRRADPVPPLLWNERIVLTRDGQVIGESVTNWNLPFARSLLDLLSGGVVHETAAGPCEGAECLGALRQTGGMSREDYDFVGEWYHAVAAYLFANGMNGDATAHLGRAAQVLPNDARLVFDRASYAETLGLPIYQAVPDDTSYQRGNGFSARIPSADKTNAEAQELYRRAVEIDPSYVEARVRLARLIDWRGHHDEAASEIATALEAKPSGVVAFYGQLVAGRIATARGRYDEALQHYRGASALFPNAQSARLGASHAALMASDIPETLAPLERLAATPATFDTDPWWDYQLGAGRDVNALMANLWARVNVK